MSTVVSSTENERLRADHERLVREFERMRETLQHLRNEAQNTVPRMVEIQAILDERMANTRK